MRTRWRTRPGWFDDVSIVEFTVGRYRLIAYPDEPPALQSDYRDRAELSEAFDLDVVDINSTYCFCALGYTERDWPILVVEQRYSPSGYGWNHGVLLVPESGVLFIGAGERLLAYDCSNTPRRLWVDQANTGFWGWSRHDDVILISAELEFAAWSIEGVKLWSTFVEPPWTYTVAQGKIDLDVMGEHSSFPLEKGPRHEF